MIPAFVAARVDILLQGLVEKRELTAVTPEERAKVEAFVYAALLDFMGPGADEFFLDLYVMASGDPLRPEGGIAHITATVPFSKEVLFTQRYLDDLAYRRQSAANKRRHTLYWWVDEIVDRQKIDTTKVLAGFRRPQDYDYYSDAFVHAMVPYLGPETIEAQYIMALQRRAVLGYVPCTDMFRDPSLLFVNICPIPSYRVDLMGELAHPWTNLPPPYDRYVPRRRS